MDQSYIKELEKKGLLINPDNLDDYLKNFNESKMSRDLINKSYWEGKRVLITGVSGFAGSHLAEKLTNLNAEVTGLVRRHSVPEYKNLNNIIKKINLVEGNLTDFSSILSILNENEPEIIFHLGAQSFVPTSFRSPIETCETNYLGSVNIFEAIRKSKVDIHKIQIACSSEQYGMVYPNEVPIKETNPFRPQSPYGASKVAVEYISRVYYEAYKLPVIITRTFNHTGPRRGLQFVTSVVSRQIAKSLVHGSKKLYIGKLDSIRDFTDIRDIVQAYLLAVERGRKSEPYNIGHGFGITIKNLIKLAASLSNVEVEIEVDKSRERPAEVEILICDYTKAKKDIGYKPRIPITVSVKDNIEYFKNNPHLLDIERH